MFRAIRPALFALDPERAHGLTLNALRHLPVPSAAQPDPILRTRIAGLDLPSPVGLAAGFDKDARVPAAMLRLGFGFVEVGTLTPRPQAGNPKPRLFRLVPDRAVINRLGFNNGGIGAAVARLAPGHPRIGVNVGANRDSADRIADYALAVEAVRHVAAFITLNISSPNTPGLRGLQDAALPELLAAAASARGPAGPPLFLKVAPDLDDAQVDSIAEAVSAAPVAALIVGNTTLERPPTLLSRHAAEAGGLSGRPLRPLAQAMLARFARALGGRVPLIGVGGIESGADAYARIRAGASAIQLYTALVYEGPGLPARINAGLAALVRRDGFATLADAVGADVRG